MASGYCDDNSGGMLVVDRYQKSSMAASVY
jgi:hypothetical protein